MNSQIITAYKLLKILSLSGITDVCYAPGSRSAPLVLALNMLKDRVEISGHVLFDERSLGFFTLGKHSAEGKKAALFTTSGSAVVNLYPAVQQAADTHQTMIVITADRPDELLGCGANQTASQGEIFGKNAVFLGIGAANREIESSWLTGRFLEKYHEALKAGLPLHINIAFREPLYTDAGRDIPLLDKTDAGLETFLSEARKRTGETLPSAIPATDTSCLYSARNIKAGTAFKGTFFLNCHLLKLPFLQKILNRREKESRNPSVVITDAALSELSAECLEPEHRDAGTGRGIKIRPFSGKYGAVAFSCGLSSRKHPVIVILTADNLIKDLSSLILLREYGITVVILSSNDDLKDDFPDIKIFAAGLGVPFLRFSISYDEAASGAGSIESAPLTLSPENSIPDINSSTSEAQIIEYRKVNQK